MFLMDVNVLVYAHREDTPDHLAYRGLFATAINPDEHDLIRASLHSGTPLGNDRFKKQIESVVDGTVGFSKQGRPLKVNNDDLKPR